MLEEKRLEEHIFSSRVPDDQIFSPFHYNPQKARHIIQEPSWTMGNIIHYTFIHSFMQEMFIEHLLCLMLGSRSQFLYSQWST